VRTIRLTLEYDGTGYVGWQVQQNGKSVQETLEQALSKLLGEGVKVTGAGRTDSGVHAAGQVASFATEREIPLRAFVAGTNGFLPSDIAVLDAAECPDTFDARRSARGKLYRYRICNRPVRSPLERRFAWEIFRPLDEAAMARAAVPLVGRHDFAAFRAADCEASTTVREVRRLQVRREETTIFVEVEATAFLKHMVRNIVGTLVDVGHGKRAEDSVAKVLEGRNRTRAGPTAPPHGLCLVRVMYEDAPSPG
jgi:tRNA pseudouridine38-40 synthase